MGIIVVFIPCGGRGEGGGVGGGGVGGGGVLLWQPLVVGKNIITINSVSAVHRAERKQNMAFLVRVYLEFKIREGKVFTWLRF